MSEKRVAGFMRHCWECGGPLVRSGGVGYMGGNKTWFERCARGCCWGQTVAVRPEPRATEVRPTDG